ncbi:coiled-coil domain-containing protein 93 isoform X2 [Cotesia typhae]|uniref:coiled-coil domain-containing protein 93 isoform X2 n=1 Tax=Cotesia typhae TaxID=2053667 RepID=UPI003D697CF6
MLDQIQESRLPSSHPEKPDIRNDNEQTVKFNEIVDLLVAAGYFRARIKGLSNFDKVIGGITWCIESCNFDVNVNFLFHENLSIGQKIALTEKIVSMLLKMSCPFRIEPHQVQGLDYIHIFPIIQWLVKKSIEIRKESAGFVRLLSHRQFYKTRKVLDKKFHSSCDSKEFNDFNIKIIKSIYEPRRRLKKDLPLRAQVPKLKSTILEYGILLFPSTSYKSLNHLEVDNNQIKIKTISTPNVKDESSKLSETIVCIDKNQIGSIVSSQINQEMETIGRNFTPCIDRKDPDSNANLYEALIKKKMSWLNQVQKVKHDQSELLQKISGMIKRMEKISENQSKIENNTFQLTNLKNFDNKSVIEKLEQLIAVHMSLKDQETKFREQCKKDLTYLKTICDTIKNSASVTKQSHYKEYDEFKLSINKIRLTLAKKNRACVLLTRQLDNVPRRFELTQYQRRFMELYNQVSAKHKETKQYYTLYNTLDDSKLYLNKELSLLNSIQDNYLRAISSSGREQFLKQFEIIIKDVQKNKEKHQLHTKI